jgi:hypothetical protein
MAQGRIVHRTMWDVVRMLGHPDTARDDGAAALEFAIVAALVLLPLLFGMIESGFILEDQLALTYAAREGARMAAVGTWDPVVVAKEATPVVPTVVVSPANPGTAASGTRITVTLTYDYAWRFLPFPGTIPLQGQATMARE